MEDRLGQSSITVNGEFVTPIVGNLVNRARGPTTVPLYTQWPDETLVVEPVQHPVERSHLDATPLFDTAPIGRTTDLMTVQRLLDQQTEDQESYRIGISHAISLVRLTADVKCSVQIGFA